MPKALAVAFSTLALAAGCADDPRAALDAEWQQMTECSAYFTLRAASAQDGRTAAARRTADTAHADAALASRYGQELGALSGRTLADTDTRLREIGSDLRDTLDGDLANIGRLRARYEDPCRTAVAEGATRIEHWREALPRS